MVIIQPNSRNSPMNIRLVGAALLLISTLSLSPIAEAQTGGVSTTFRVSGQVTNPVIFNLAKLQKFAVSTQNVTFFAAGQVTSGSYTGALLWDVLQSAGIKVDPNVKNDILRFIVVVTGSDGYEAIFGAGEIDPEFGGDQIIIAYAENGQSLGQDGFAKIIAPGDKAGGRFVSNIVKIEVRDVGLPQYTH
ncbi:MAG: molybdopterin-dependent oxidoreductase [Methylocella sp.]